MDQLTNMEIIEITKAMLEQFWAALGISVAILVIAVAFIAKAMAESGMKKGVENALRKIDETESIKKEIKKMEEKNKLTSLIELYAFQAEKGTAIGEFFLGFNNSTVFITGNIEVQSNSYPLRLPIPYGFRPPCDIEQCFTSTMGSVFTFKYMTKYHQFYLFPASPFFNKEEEKLFINLTYPISSENVPIYYNQDSNENQSSLE